MEDLLYLVHRIPYPPNKGDKVRSYHLLRFLAERYRVHLGAFVDDPADWQHRGVLEDLCASVELRPLGGLLARLRSLPGLLGRDPLTVPFYRDGAMARWVDARLDGGVRRIVVFSAAMAQYVLPRLCAGQSSIADLVDVDSDKWRQYAERRPWPLSWVYRREWRTLLELEARIARAFDHTLFVSRDEADLFRRLAPDASERVGHLNNGVDTGFFSPDRDYPRPFPEGSRAVVFTGAMDYWANIDAVEWFARDVFPPLRARHPDVDFYVVGARPTPGVEALARLPGVTVTGTVDDVRRYIAHAQCCVAPMRVARGVQNKVLEAMAMARPVVASPAAIEGIDAGHDLESWSAEGVSEFGARVEALLGHPEAAAIGAAHRRFVIEHYGWERSLATLLPMIEEGSPRPMPDRASAPTPSAHPSPNPAG